MTRMLLQCPQPSRNSVSPLVKAAKPDLEPRLAHRSGLSPRLRMRPRLNIPAGGWRRFGGPPPAKCGGWWDQIGDRTRRPEPLVLSCGCLRSGPNNVSRCPSALLSRLSRPSRLPSGIERHLPHLTHTVLRDPSDNERLVDPRLELIQRRNRAARDHPVVGDVSLRPLDAGNLRSMKAETFPSD